MRHVLVCILVLLAASATFAAEPAAQWYKGNTHAHCLWSDGGHLPEQVVEWYKDHGYQFLALTDHNTLQAGTRWREVSMREKQTKVLTEARQRYGTDWVQTRPGVRLPAKGATGEAESGVDVRLKTLEELAAKFQEPGKFLLISGEEFTDRVEKLPLHLCALNIQAALRPAPLPAGKSAGRKMQAAIAEDLQIVQAHAAAIQQPVLVHLNHPNFQYALTAEDLAGAPASFVEVINGNPSVNNWGDSRHIPVERMWDIANSLRVARGVAPLYGVGSDDAHTLAGSATAAVPGRAWIVVRAEALSGESLLEAMNRGDFYFSTGVALAQVEYDRRRGAFTVEVQAEPDAQYTIQFIGTMQDADLSAKPAPPRAAAAPATSPAKTASAPAERISGQYGDQVGQVLREVRATRSTYTLTGKELFVRAVVGSNKPSAIDPNHPQQAWCQPFGWDKRVRDK